MCLNVQHSRHRCSAKPRKKLDIAKLNSATVQQQLVEKLNTIFEKDIETAPDGDTEWARLRDPLYGAAHEILGVTQRKHRDWFDENDTEAMNILDNMYTSHITWINDKNSPSKATSYRHYKQQAQARLRAMKEAWWSD